jgi:CheY-like chemotaxis protein
MADPRQILIIDDDPDFLDYLEIILAANGYEVQKATGADQGLALMRACCPALVIVDVMMSYVLDGWAIGREIRDDPALRRVPIIMVSAIVSDTDDPLFPGIDEAHFDAFLSKPVDPATLLRRIEELLAVREDQ